jgi:hypothetical protein
MRVAERIMRVSPSGSVLARTSALGVPDAPLRSATMNCCPVFPADFCATSRATLTFEAPGGQGASTQTDFAG